MFIKVCSFIFVSHHFALYCFLQQSIASFFCKLQNNIHQYGKAICDRKLVHGAVICDFAFVVVVVTCFEYLCIYIGMTYQCICRLLMLQIFGLVIWNNQRIIIFGILLMRKTIPTMKKYERTNLDKHTNVLVPKIILSPVYKFCIFCSVCFVWTQ